MRPGTIRSPRPGHWERIASWAAHDFVSYVAFVHQKHPEPHHEVIIERLLYGGNLELILGPPDCGKSTWGQWFVEWTLGRNPNWRWLIASEISSGIATVMVTSIGETIAENERYAFVFGQLQDPTGRAQWSTMAVKLRTYISPQSARVRRQAPTPAPPSWMLTPEPNRPPGVPPISPNRGRDPGLAHPNLKAVGWRTGYTGVRAEGILADDLVSLMSSRSDVLTDAVYSTLHQKLLARLTGPLQRCVIFGQRWAPRDLYGRIEENGCVVADNNPEMKGLHVFDEATA